MRKKNKIINIILIIIIIFLIGIVGLEYKIIKDNKIKIGKGFSFDFILGKTDELKNSNEIIPNQTQNTVKETAKNIQSPTNTNTTFPANTNTNLPTNTQFPTATISPTNLPTSTVFVNPLKTNNPIQTKKPTSTVAPTIEYSSYHEQLNQFGTKIYDALNNNIENLKTGTYVINMGSEFDELLKTETGNEVLNSAYQSAIASLLLDKPEIFYLDVSKIYLTVQSISQNGKTTYNVTIGPKDDDDYLIEGLTKAKINMILDNLDDIRKKIYGECILKTEYEKIKYVHDYLIDNIMYDEFTGNSESSHSIYGALIRRTCVCEGYAKAFKYILDKFEIESIIVYGIGINSTGQSENHGWNYVKLSGKWYAVDVTWDDPIISAGGILTNDMRYQYLLKGKTNFFNQHTETGIIAENSMQFKYPILSDNDYKQ